MEAFNEKITGFGITTNYEQTFLGSGRNMIELFLRPVWKNKNKGETNI